MSEFENEILKFKPAGPQKWKVPTSTVTTQEAREALDTFSTSTTAFDRANGSVVMCFSENEYDKIRLILEERTGIK